MSPQEYNRTALVTGATGFVGSHLTRKLVADGWFVHVVVRRSSSLDQLLAIRDSIVVHRHDGTTEGMLHILRDIRPDTVFHLGSLFISEHKHTEIDALVQANLLFGVQLVEAMVAVGCLSLVNTGTSWQHYHGADYNPVNLYAATKQAFEDLLRYYTEVKGLNVITLKLFDTYGPDDSRPKLFSLLKALSETGDSLAMSPGEQLLDLVFIDDAVLAFVLAAEQLLAETVSGCARYAVSSGEHIQLKELIARFSSTTGKKISITWGGRSYRKREVMVPWDKGEILPGWKPEISLEEGIRQVVHSWMFQGP